MGTPEFAVASLKRLVEEGYNIVAVVTTPDKPAGRGQKIHESDVKVAARELGLPILQPEKLRDLEFVQAMQELQPDLGIVSANNGYLLLAVGDNLPCVAITFARQKCHLKNLCRTLLLAIQVERCPGCGIW